MLLSPALVLLIALAQACGVTRSSTSIGLVCAVAALSLGSITASQRAGGVQRLVVLLRPALSAMLLTPLAWMVVQLVPTPLGWLSDLVWASTSSALNLPIAGSISVDIGATLLAVAMYCAVLATALTVAALASDKRSAAGTLYLLTAMAATVAATEIARDLGYCRRLESAGVEVGSVLVAAIGIVMSCSLLIGLHGQLSRKDATGGDDRVHRHDGRTRRLYGISADFGRRRRAVRRVFRRGRSRQHVRHPNLVAAQVG